jgi:beta-mannosidase
MLVWQDFPMIGGYVRGITERAEAQAREMVDFLSHHPSIVAWGAHVRPHTDEVRTTSAPDLRRQQMPSWNRSVLDRAVSRTMRADDPSRRTVAHSDVAPHIPHLRGSDLGQYFGWFDRPASELAEYAAALPRFVRFVSDLGSQALPEHIEHDLDSLLEVAGAEVDALHAVIPASDYAEASNWVHSTRNHQADVLKTTIETLRALKYRPVGGFCAGLWRAVGPGLSRALIDHDGTPRPALAATKSALQPVLPLLYPPEPTLHAHSLTTMAVYICNDRDEDLELTVTATVTDQRGTSTKRWSGRADADEVTYLGDIEVRGGRIGHDATIELVAEGTHGPSTNRYVISAT